MRLGDVPLGLQHRHVVADGGAGNAQVVALYQGLRADGFLGGHKVGDDGAQHLKTTLVGTAHRLSPPGGADRVHFMVSNGQLTIGDSSRSRDSAYDLQVSLSSMIPSGLDEPSERIPG